MKKITISMSVLLIFSMVMLTSCATASAAAQPTATPVALPTVVPAKPALALPETSGMLAAFQNTLEDIYAQVSPSVVTIHVVEETQASTSTLPGIPGFPFFNSPDTNPVPQEGLGSGFVWDQQGDIVTNNHVVDGATTIDVIFSDGSTVPAKVVGTDPDSDLAVIKVDVAADQLQPVQFADSSQIKVGQLAIAIGNPFGYQETMTVGIISALGRSLPSADVSNSQGPVFENPDIIQTDAPINPGNSGGVLLNDQGQVIGVTSAIESPVQANIGIGFAIPSATVMKVVPVLIQTGHYEHTWLGISGLTLTPDLASAMDLSPDQRGALVEEISSGSPADKAKLQGSGNQVTINGNDVNVGGDVIIGVDGQPVNSMSDLITYLTDNTEVGQQVSLTILRNGKEETVSVTLAPRPATTKNSSVVGELPPTQTP